jgi:dTDP-4-amino-4,6-dideoxygalactose transaminase
MDRMKTVASGYVVPKMFGMKQSIERKNLLMGPLRAIAGNIGLDTLSQVDNHRNEIARSFEKRLDNINGYKRPIISGKKEPTFLRYSILNETKHKLSHISRAARRKDFEIGNYNWPKPVHLLRGYDAIFSGGAKDLKTSELIASNIINLPVHYYVNQDDVDAIVTMLSEF